MIDPQLSSLLMAETQVPQSMPAYDFDFSSFDDDGINRKDKNEENPKVKVVEEVDDILLDGLQPSMDYENFVNFEDFNMCLSSILSDENDDQWNIGMMNNDGTNAINLRPDQGKSSYKLVHHHINLNNNENHQHPPSLMLSPSLSSTSTASIFDEPSISLGDNDDFRYQMLASADEIGDRSADRKFAINRLTN